MLKQFWGFNHFQRVYIDVWQQQYQISDGSGVIAAILNCKNALSSRQTGAAGQQQLSQVTDCQMKGQLRVGKDESWALMFIYLLLRSIRYWRMSSVTILWVISHFLVSYCGVTREHFKGPPPPPPPPIQPTSFQSSNNYFIRKIRIKVLPVKSWSLIVNPHQHSSHTIHKHLHLF